MRKNSFGLVASSLTGILSALLVACNNPMILNNSTLDTNKPVQTKVQENTKYTLRGNIQLPQGFNTKASFSDLASKASVVFLDLNNNALSSAVNSSTTGSFVINPISNFIPVTNNIYVIEATKRAAADSRGPLLALRTYVRWNGAAYESITGSNIFLNTYTTALTILAQNRKITGASTINNITVSGNTSTPKVIASSTGFAGATVAEIIDLTKMVQNAIYLQKDPVGNIMMSGANFALDIADLSPLSNGGQGMQIDRLALPSLNIVINGFNGFTKAAYTSLGADAASRNAAKDLSNTQSPKDDITNYRGFWTVAIKAALGRTDADASAIATALTPDVYTLDMTKATSFATLNGRKLTDDVIDVELALLSGATNATDKVNANDKTFGTSFPYLAQPF